MKILEYLTRLRTAYNISLQQDRTLWGYVKIIDIASLDEAIAEASTDLDYDDVISAALSEVPKI